MIPASGTPLSHWDLQPDDFEYLTDTEGNGRNLVALSLTWFNLLKDSPVDPGKPYRVTSDFYRRLSYGKELRVMIREYKKLGNRLLRGVRVDGSKVSGFGCTDPLFRSFAKTPIFREYRAWVRTGDAKIFTYLLSFLWWGSKADYVNPDLPAISLMKWLDIEDEMKRLRIPDHVVEDLARLIRLSGFKVLNGHFYPQHGPGQVAEGLKRKSVHEKNRRLAFDQLDEDVIYRDAFSTNLDSPGYRYFDPNEGLSYDKRHELQDEAQVAFVVKDEGSLRTICMEPIRKMYLQQGLYRASIAGLEQSMYRDHIDIKDQTKNQMAARLGSYFGGLFTGDLEGASDRMSWQLVSRILPGAFVKSLDDTRTKAVRVLDGDAYGPIIIETDKAFPMGSAMNFLVQSLVFCTIVALAHVIDRNGLDVEDYLSEGMDIVRLFPEMEMSTRVYGDDIILPEKHSRTLMRLLAILGFKLNLDKSFNGSDGFCESCGIFALHGQEVTPLRFKVKGLRQDTSESWLSLIDLANRALVDYGYRNVRDAIKLLLPEDTYVDVPYKGSDYDSQMCALIGDLPDFESRGVRYNSELQRWEKRILTSCRIFRETAVKWEGEGWSYRKATEGEPLQDLERYYLGQWLYTNSGEKWESEDSTWSRTNKCEDPWYSKIFMTPFWDYSGKPPPRDGLEVPSAAEWGWTPICCG